MTLNPVPPEPVTGPPPNDLPKHNYRAKIVKALRATQKYSAYGIVAFAGLHVTNTVILPAFSINTANSAFMASRSVYQSPLGELVLVYGSFGAHILSGLALQAYRAINTYIRTGKITFGRPSGTAISGLLLSVVSVVHFLTTRYGPLVILGDSSLISLDYISHFLQKHISKAGMSLTSLVTLFAVHSVDGANRYFNLGLNKTHQWTIVTGMTAFAITSLTALARRPHVGGWIGDQFDLGLTYT